jgi:hypothetical protein
MPLYFFSLSDQSWPYHSGEDLANDEAAKAHGVKVETDLRSKRTDKPTVRVFSADGKRVS